jgi:ABC-type branched-subunit amino acid transport system substrate-binding protein
MIKDFKLTLTLLALGFLIATFAPARPATVDAFVSGDDGEPKRQRPLTPQEARGKAIYLRGESRSGGDITAKIAGMDVPASTLTCAGCHGVRGEGKTEGGVTAGNLRWSHLLEPHTHPTGRRHAAFDQASFARAVSDGVDPAGNELAVAMPRFQMSSEDMADLVAYLHRLGHEREPGLTETGIRVAMILPSTGALAEMGAAMREVVTAYFDEVNGRGGVFGRRIELSATTGPAGTSQVVASTRRLIEDEEVFALVGGISAGADRELAALASEFETPLVGPATLLPPAASHTNRQVFYLLPGLAEQARALLNFAAIRTEPKVSRILAVHSVGEITEAAAAAVEDQALKSGLRPVIRQSYEAESLDPRGLVRKIKGDGSEALFLFGGATEASAIIREAAASGWTPRVFMLGALTGMELAQVLPPSYNRRVFVAFPTVPSDITPAGLAEFRALHEKHKLTARHRASQLAALAAARVFVEGLRRVGRDLSREKLITALEGLYNYDTGLTPRITFGPNRRIGAAGASVLTFDLEKQEFVATGGWVKSY